MPKTSSRKIVRAALLGLTDPHLRDRNILDTIYALAIKHRMDEFRHNEDGDDERDNWPALSRVARKRNVATRISPEVSAPQIGV